MKAFFRKLKKSKLSIRLIYYFVMLLFLVSYILFTKSLLSLSNIETTIRIIVIITLGTLLLIYWFINLLLLLSKKNAAVVVISVFAMLISCVSIVGSIYIDRAHGYISNMTDDNEVVYTTKLVLLKDTTFANSDSFVVGMINNDTDVEGNTLALELIKKEKIDNIKINKYDSYYEMLEYLYDGKINGLFLGGEYVETFSPFDQYANIGEETKVQFEYSKKMKPAKVIENTNSNVTEPFTILLIGVDSDKDRLNFNSGFNGDTLMVASFNPKTLSATVFSIPRDTYVPICNKGISSKINSSSAYGGQCVVKTVENLIDIKIDYYAMINFKGVVDLVDNLGGITVDVEPPTAKNKYNGQVCEQDSKRRFGENLICMDTGVQRLNGEQALAYSRCRHLYLSSDFARIQHQQDVVQAMANELKKLKSIDDFYKVLESISKNLVTNMSTANIMSLYNVFKSTIANSNSDSLINIQKTFLNCRGENIIIPNISRTMAVSALIYSEASLNEIKDALKVTLELKKPTLIKTFSFDINEAYEPKVIGKSTYSYNDSNTPLPSFIGKSVDYAKSWCQEHNISYSIEQYDPDDEKYNSEYGEGYIVYQSLLKNTIVSTIKEITFGINGISTTKSTTSTTEKTTEKTTTTSGNEGGDVTPTPTPGVVDPALGNDY